MWVNRGPLGMGNWITDELGRQIAVTYGERTNPNSAADTVLIAAAPDLLAALRMLHDNLAEYQSINNLGGYDNQDMQQARAAIAKATNGE